ncbi:hypothetical protein GWI33_013906 [Rhynchophorus ferrugineus]|uniref:Uncharacterized protein n=1 Tax=Rhynchophorus ferrugineus TaxID=354439 RepID=A0A834I2J9_RHYFE|nr:hypothetical protein GWI33_013906 [Rhynchophorus ferrugineus]
MQVFMDKVHRIQYKKTWKHCTAHLSSQEILQKRVADEHRLVVEGYDKAALNGTRVNLVVVKIKRWD